jgi:hypothetical protein
MLSAGLLSLHMRDVCGSGNQVSEAMRNAMLWWMLLLVVQLDSTVADCCQVSSLFTRRKAWGGRDERMKEGGKTCMVVACTADNLDELLKRVARE